VDALREGLAPLAESGRVYLVGQVRSSRVPVSPPTVAVAQDRVTLSFAPLAELDGWPSGPLRDVDLRVQVRHAPGAVLPPLELEATASRLPALIERHLP
jgi:inner membrane protein